MSKKPKKKLTPNQAAWEKEMKLLRERANYWEKKFRAAFTDFPAKPKKITKEAIERLRNIRWKNLTDEQKHQYRNVYDNMYDDGQITPNVPSKPYEPPTEDDWYNGRTDGPFEPDESWNDELDPVISEQEMDAWINERMFEILEDSRNSEVRYMLEHLMVDAQQRMGTAEFYTYLQQPEVTEKLNRAAQNATKYLRRRNSSDATLGIPQESLNSINEFATILNQGRPLTPEQSYTLTTEGYIDFDYSD